MKILYFIDGLRAGGKERQLVALIKGLVAGGNHEITVAVMNEDVHYKEIFDLGIDVRYFVRKSRRDRSIFSKVYRFLKELRPDVLHVWDSLTATYSLPAAKWLGIKIVNGAIRHAAPPKPFRKFWFLSKITFALSHRVVSNSMAGLVANNLKPSTKHRCIVNGFDPNRMTRLVPVEEIKKKFNITTPLVVGMVAGFEDRKDYKGLIAAAEQILTKRRDVTFVAVGDGKNSQEIKDLVKDEYNEYIKLPGRQSDVESIINVFDIGLLINNTLGHAEGISNSIMEYMALGKPVIASDSGGNKELVLDNETGFIIQPFDVEALVKRIGQLLDDKNKARQMGQLGKKRIEDEFSLEGMVKRYEGLYEGLVNSGKMSGNREPGTAKGQFSMSDDFEEPLELRMK